MDIVTHLAAGALSAQAIRNPERHARLFLWFCILAAWLPDIDNVVGFWGSEFYLIYHRGLTHSFFVTIPIAVMLAGLFKFFVRSFPFERGVLFAYLFMALHIFLDLITSYGTQIFFPFTNTRYMIPCVFIIDPLYTLVMLVLLYLALRRSARTRRTMAIAGVLWVFLYPTLNFGIRSTLEYRLEHDLRRKGMNIARLEVSTDLLTPIFWKVIIDDGAAFQLGGINLFKPYAPMTLTRFRKAEPALFQELGKSAPVFQTYSWFFDYPVVSTTVSEDGKETLMTLEDLRFASTLAFVQNARKGAPAPFAVTAVLDENRRVLRYYSHR